jgi:hypothetical protein
VVNISISTKVDILFIQCQYVPFETSASFDLMLYALFLEIELLRRKSAIKAIPSSINAMFSSYFLTALSIGEDLFEHHLPMFPALSFLRATKFLAKIQHRAASTT